MAQFLRVNERHTINLDAITYVYQYEDDPALGLRVEPTPGPWLVIWFFASHNKQDGLHLSGADASKFLDWLNEHNEPEIPPQETPDD